METIDSSFAEPGTLVTERYQIIDRLGSGGMGTVFRAADRYLNNDLIALKLLYPSLVAEKQLFTRFRNEVILARKLSHPNIVRIFDFGDAGHGYFFITMEYVDGMPLNRRLECEEKRMLPLPEIWRILFETCVALHFAHQNGVLHRDIKPDNILMSKSGDVKLSDFGAARHMKVDHGITKTGELVGTPYYMAPEAFRAEKLDARADIYSLGILAYELGTGRLPFLDDTIVGIIAKHLNHPLPSLEQYRHDTPSWYIDFVETCSEKLPGDRFQTMAEAAEVLYTQLCSIGKPPRLSVLPDVLWRKIPASESGSGFFSFLTRKH